MSHPHYVIVGAGTAGPVIAARLTEDPTVDVVLLEAGKENTYEASRTQGAFFALHGSEADWQYETTAQPGIGGRSITHPRGKVVGGSCALNVGAWLRGTPGDYDVWSKEGAQGWDGAEALRAYLRIEDTDRGPSQWRGAGGPMTLSDLPSPTSLPDALLDGFTEAGYGARGDSAGATPYVADRFQSIFKTRTRRTSADAYLDEEVRARPNLRIVTEALVSKVVFDGARATGVVYEKGGTEHTLDVEREVILCAGVINTPQLLMLSGVGPAAHLREHGIEVVADLPGVGENLHDHPVAPVVALAPSGVGGSYQGNPLSDESLAQWRLDRTGPTAFFSQNGVGFVARTPGSPVPDYELLFDYNPDISDDSPVAGATGGDQRSGYKVWAVLLHPKSRGTLRLASADPHDKPVIDPKYLSHPDDLPDLVDAMRHAQKVTQSPSLAPYTEAVYPAIGAPDSEFHEAILKTMYTTYHLVGTARMGDPSDDRTVVDPQLRVRGVTGLRVADASVIPSLISGHTIAPSIMIGERAVELIRETS
ncbi:GMC family oxidoreductase [Streptomyces prunicolor]|uniref:GMC family oxidoreductase N-terminal domain-containing protein n=1 Tax=Streptomyces prunicolor TaxID=67348 RepID=A0ABU4F196_9ACTN|nr:GMC family oxidoreductase N-terminal domain-containing protein [Streptomyces prunicolor]MDV7214363.1 GMC family oxidoreductase N-terminal domain-containing protein [Streptomyces prunicolor]